MSGFKKFFLISVPPLVLMFTFYGCAAREAGTGPQLSVDKVAIVRIATPSKIGRVKLEKVDDVELEGWQDRVEIPSGKRTIQVSYFYGDGITSWSSEVNCKLTFDAQGGHVYQVNATVDFKNKKWTGTLVDVISNTPLDQCGH